jgi:hypothetical protein
MISRVYCRVWGVGEERGLEKWCLGYSLVDSWTSDTSVRADLSFTSLHLFAVAEFEAISFNNTAITINCNDST